MNSVNNPDEVSRDTVYEQLYQEMRRHRDYEMVVSGWYTTVALGVIAGLFAISNVNIERWFVWLFSAFFVLAGLGISYVIWYTHDRYSSLRKFTDQIIEPEWKGRPRIRQTGVKPHHVLILINLMLTVTGVIVAFAIIARPS